MSCFCPVELQACFSLHLPPPPGARHLLTIPRQRETKKDRLRAVVFALLLLIGMRAGYGQVCGYIVRKGSAHVGGVLFCADALSGCRLVNGFPHLAGQGEGYAYRHNFACCPGGGVLQGKQDMAAELLG